MSDISITHHIYGRKAYAEPLRYVGALTISAQDELRDAALERFGADWVELIALPVEDIVTVVSPTSPTSPTSPASSVSPKAARGRQP